MSDILLLEGNIIADQLLKHLPIQDVPFPFHIASCPFHVVFQVVHPHQCIILLPLDINEDPLTSNTAVESIA